MSIFRIGLAISVSLSLAIGAASPSHSSGCSIRDARRLIEGTFVDAYNNGRLAELDRLFARGDRFSSYRVQPIERVAGPDEDRSTLIDYFAERHSYRDEIQITDLDITKYRNRPGYGFSLVLRRSSEQVMPFADGVFAGKGGMSSCEIATWNMGWIGP